MDTLEWNSSLAARNKEPIITVREILQDSDGDDQIAEMSLSQSPRKRNHHEIERSSDLTISIRKPSSEKEQVSPAKRHRNGQGLGSIRLHQKHDDDSQTATCVKTNIMASEKGKERVSDTPSLGTIFGQANLAQLGEAPPSPPEFDQSRAESSTSHESMIIDQEILPLNTSGPSLSSARLQTNTRENPKYCVANDHKHISNTSFESLHPEFQEPDQYERILKIFESPHSKLQESKDKYEHVTKTFESLYPLVEDWIRLQQSQLDAVTQRINRILGLIQQGERLQQNVLTAEMATQLQATSGHIINGISQGMAVHVNGQERDLAAQFQKVYNTTDYSQCLIALEKFRLMSVLSFRETSKTEHDFFYSIRQLSDQYSRLEKEFHSISMKDAENFSLMLEMNRREQTQVLLRINGLKKAMAAYYAM